MNFEGLIGPAYQGVADTEQLINWYLAPSRSKGGVLAPTPGLAHFEIQNPLQNSRPKGPGGTTPIPPLAAPEIGGIPVVDEIDAFKYWKNNFYTVAGGKLYQTAESKITGESSLGIAVEQVNVPKITEMGILSGGRAYLEAGETQLAVLSGGFLHIFDGLQTAYVPSEPIYSSITYSNNRLILTEKDTKTFYISATNDFSTIDFTQFDSADLRPDNIVRGYANKDEIYFFCEETTEVWFFTGDTFPYSRHPGAFKEIGLAAVDSPATIKDGVMFLGRSGAGLGFYFAAGLEFRPIDASGIIREIESYSTVSDARATVEEHSGGAFYNITFPSADRTWSYDLNSGQWHRRKSADMGRWRVKFIETLGGRSFAALDNVWTVAEIRPDLGTDIKVYKPDINLSTVNKENVWYTQRKRVTPIINIDNRKVKYSNVEFNFSMGLGQATPDNGVLSDATGDIGGSEFADPLVGLRYSDDGGKTWSNERLRSLGKVGEYGLRTKFSRLGRAVNRVFEINCSAPLPIYLRGGTIG